MSLLSKMKMSTRLDQECRIGDDSNCLTIVDTRGESSLVPSMIYAIQQSKNRITTLKTMTDGSEEMKITKSNGYMRTLNEVPSVFKDYSAFLRIALSGLDEMPVEALNLTDRDIINICRLLELTNRNVEPLHLEPLEIFDV